MGKGPQGWERKAPALIGSLGDVVEDILVHLTSPIHHASDTEARITRRRGGSAATVAAVAAKLSGQARFLGQIGPDPLGMRLRAELAADGVEFVGQSLGETGTIVVLVDPDGERTMLSDRGSSSDLTDPVPAWLDGLHTLHVPFYSLAVEPLAQTAQTLIRWAVEKGLCVSVDASSTSVLQEYGTEKAIDLLCQLTPTVVLFNEEEADALKVTGRPDQFSAQYLVVKHGPKPAVLFSRDRDRTEVPVPACPEISNTTGAGDAFAAGLLTALAAGTDPEPSVLVGHQTAASFLTNEAYAWLASGS